MSVTLDHTSVETRVAGLNFHRDGVFRFYRLEEGQLIPVRLPWRLVHVTDDGVRICLRDEACSGGAIITCTFRLSAGWLLNAVSDLWRWRVVLVTDTSPVDDSQRRRLDENLKGVFA